MPMSGGIEDDDNVPGLVDSPPDSDEEEYVLPSSRKVNRVPGKFPWQSETACTQYNFNNQATRWMRLKEDQQESAFGAVKRLLVTPFLFQQLVIPEKWIRWARSKEMIEFEHLKKKLPSGKLSRHHYLVVRMFDISLKKLQTLIDKKRTVAAIMKMMYSIRNVPTAEIDRAIRETKTNENVKILVDFLKGEIKNYTQKDRDFYENFERITLTALLCLRQFAEIVYIITCEGRDIGVEVKNHFSDHFYYLKEDHKIGREKGNKFYKNERYQDAINAYTEAIDKTPFHYLLYSNRCQALIRMSDYESAFTDAYRTVVLNPDWGKGYYKVVLCLSEMGFLDEALDWGKQGLAKCGDDEMTVKSLKDLMEHITSKRMLEKGSDIHSGLKSDVIAPKEGESGAIKKKGKSKKKKRSKTKKEEEVPELISDDEFEECPVNVDKFKKDEETEKKRVAQRIKDEKERKKREELEKKERQTLQGYEKSLQKAAEEFLKSHYADACKSYSISINLMENHKEVRGYTENDFATLIYARGISSQRQGLAHDIDLSRHHFRRIINEHKMFSHLGMAYYADAKSTYLLNDFERAIKQVSTALQMVKKFPIHGVLTWPGSSENIPESDENVLRKEIHLLLQQCKVPPIPTAICQYEGCLKDYTRKQIYSTDLNFEGYFEVLCDWRCVLSFHLRCWAKFKHDKLNISGDKEVLGMACFTPDCRGKIMLIRMLDGRFLEKKNLKLSPEHKRKEIKFKPSKHESRTSKSENNLRKFKQAQLEKQQRREEQKLAGNRESPVSLASKNKKKRATEPCYISADRDLSEATIYVKNDSSQGANGKRSLAKRHVTPASLHLYCSQLPGYKKIMSLKHVNDAIEKAKANGTSFALPDDLREEIEQFALSLSTEEEPVLFTDDEKIKIPFLFEHFVNFLSEGGPIDTNSDLFLKKLIEMPDSMRKVVGKCGGLVAFLNSSPLFIQVQPFIGVHSQHQNMKKLTERPRKHSRDTASQNSPVDLSPFLDYEDAGLSQFAKEFYQIGANVEDSDILNLTGAATDLTPNYSQGDMYKLDQFPDPRKLKNSQNSETSSMYSLEDFTEMSSQASFDASGGRPPTPHKKQMPPPPQPKKQVPKKKLTTSATQTEGRDEAEKAKEAVVRLQERLQEMQDDFTKLKRTSQTAEESLIKNLEEAAERERIAIREKDQIKQAAEVELAKIPQYKKQVQNTEAKLEQVRAKEREVQNNLSSLSAGMQQEREIHLKKILELQKSVDRRMKDVETNRRRAITAEVDLTRTKEAYHVGAHMQAKSHCEQGVREFDIELTRLSAILPDHIMTHFKLARKQWVDSVISCAKTIETLKAAYASIIDQINAGRPLSELPSVPDLKPPPPGPNPRHMMIQLQRSGTLNNVGAPNNGSGDGHVAAGRSPVVNGTNSPIPVANNKQTTSPLPPVTKARETAPPTIAAPPQPPIGSELPKAPRKKNFLQLVDKLSKNLPQLSRPEVEECAQRVRAENRGLTGLLYEEIEQRIREMVGLGADEQAQASKPGPSLPTSAPSIWKIGSSAFMNSRDGGDFWQVEDEAVCPICCDPLKEGRISTLECQHKFHFECISKWMQKQRTCPNCRKFMPDSSEFPSLAAQQVPPGLLRNHN